MPQAPSSTSSARLTQPPAWLRLTPTPTAAATAAAPATVQASALLPAQQPQPPANNAAIGNHPIGSRLASSTGRPRWLLPVTLVETMSKNPGDRNAWKKGDRRFGAIHKGRTYSLHVRRESAEISAKPRRLCSRALRLRSGALCRARANGRWQASLRTRDSRQAHLLILRRSFRGTASKNRRPATYLRCKQRWRVTIKTPASIGRLVVRQTRPLRQIRLAAPSAADDNLG